MPAERSDAGHPEVLSSCRSSTTTVRDITTFDRILGRADELKTLRALIMGPATARAAHFSSTATRASARPPSSRRHSATSARSECCGLGIRGRGRARVRGVQRLGRPLAPYIDDIPPPARRAAGGRRPGRDPPKRPLVGLGVLSIFARAGDDIPTICVIDDAHHLDASRSRCWGSPLAGCRPRRSRSSSPRATTTASPARWRASRDCSCPVSIPSRQHLSSVARSTERSTRRHRGRRLVHGGESARAARPRCAAVGPES